MDSLRPAIPGVSPGGEGVPAGDPPDDSAANRPSTLEASAAAISGGVPEPALAPEDAPPPEDDGANDPETFEPPLAG